MQKIVPQTRVVGRDCAMLPDIFPSEIEVKRVMRRCKIRSFQKNLKAVIYSIVHGGDVFRNPAFISNDQDRIPPGFHPADYFGINDRIIGGDVDTPYAIALQDKLGGVMELIKFSSCSQVGKNLP